MNEIVPCFLEILSNLWNTLIKTLKHQKTRYATFFATRAVTPRSGFGFSFLMLLMRMIMFSIPMLERLLLFLSEDEFSRCDPPIMTAGDLENLENENMMQKA